MFCVYQKQIEKKCLLRFQIQKKLLKTIKTTVYKKRKIRIFPKVLVHRFCQKFEISSTLIFIQNRPRKSIWESSSQEKVSIILCNSLSPLVTRCNPLYSHVIDRENESSKNDFRRFIQQTSLSEQRKHRFQKPTKLAFFQRGQSTDLINNWKF